MGTRRPAALFCLAALLAAPVMGDEPRGAADPDFSRLSITDFLLKARSLVKPRTPASSAPAPAKGAPVPSIFDPAFSFSPSALPAVGAGGVFSAHGDSDGQIALLTNGEASLAARLQTLRGATRSIRIEALIFFGDETGLYIADILKRLKAERPGLDIRVIVDSLSNMVDEKAKKDPARWAQTQLMYYDLEQNGIPVEGFAPIAAEWVNEVSVKDPVQFNKRFHDKLWIVDGETPQGVAIMGGMNVANEYFRMEASPEHRWRDQDIIVRGSVVADLVETFDRNFKYQEAVKASRGPFNTDLTLAAFLKIVGAMGHLPFRYRIENPGGGRPAQFKIKYFEDPSVVARIRALEQTVSAPAFSPAKTRFIQSRPRLKETYITQAYLAMIKSARSEILIANAYFIPRGDVLRALQAAVRRGVDVTILTNSDATNDMPQLVDVSRFLYQDLLSAGEGSGGRISIHEWTGQAAGAPRQEGTMHAKYMVVDRQDMIVGSYNLDPRSEQLNSETVMALESAPLAQQLARQYVEDDLFKARLVTAEDAALYHQPTDIAKKFRLGFSMSLDSWIGF